MKYLPILISFWLIMVARLGFAGQADVSVAPLADIAIYPERTAPATVISLNEAVLSAQVSAVVQAIEVHVGDRVNGGDRIALLECDEYELGEKNAKAVLDAVDARIELAKLNFERVERLFKSNAVSQGDLDASVAELTALRADRRGALASLGIAEINRERCAITSPSQALVLERLASVGQLAMPGTAMLRVLDLESIEVSAQVFSRDASKLSADTKARLEVDGKSYPLVVRVVVGAVDSTTRNREVRLFFVGEQALPGSAGKLVWNDVTPHLPPTFVVERDGSLGVFIYDNGIARFVELPDAREGRINPVPMALSTQVIVDGQYNLQHDDAITLR